jgi:hypothetical protein
MYPLFFISANISIKLKTLDSSSGIATGHGMDGWSSIPGKVKWFFSSL